MIDSGTLSSPSVTDKDFAGNYGLKVAMAMGWFAGDKNMCRIYTEIFRDEDPLSRILRET